MYIFIRSNTYLITNNLHILGGTDNSLFLNVFLKEWIHTSPKCVLPLPRKKDIWDKSFCKDSPGTLTLVWFIVILQITGLSMESIF